MKITVEISVAELMEIEKWNSIKQQIKRTLFEKQDKEPEVEQATSEEDLKILAGLKEKLVKETPEEPAPEQTTARVEVLIDGEGWKLFDDIDKAAKAIDARREHLIFALNNKKTCNGMQVRFYNPERKKVVNTKSVKVEKRSKEYPDSVIKTYNSIRKCAAEEGIGYANLSQQLKKHKKYEFGPYVFTLVEPIDETLKQIEEDKKKPYEISK